MGRNSTPILLAMIALAPQAFAVQASNEALERYSLEPDQVLVTYQVALGPSDISGVSSSLEWSLVALPGGAMQVRLRVPVDSFRSGHSALDSALREAFESRRFPMVEVEGVARAGESPLRFDGTLTLHGVVHPLSASVTAVRAGSMVVVRSSFDIDVSLFGLSHPPSRLPRLGNRVKIDFLARLRAHRDAVASGGVVNGSR